MSKDGQYVAKGHDCMDAGDRTNQETESRKSEAIILQGCGGDTKSRRFSLVGASCRILVHHR